MGRAHAGDDGEGARDGCASHRDDVCPRNFSGAGLEHHGQHAGTFDSRGLGTILMRQLVLIGTEIFLSGMALLILLGEAVFPKARKIFLYKSIASLLLVIFYFVFFFIYHQMPFLSGLGVEPATVRGGWIEYSSLLNMISVDSLSVFFK